MATSSLGQSNDEGAFLLITGQDPRVDTTIESAERHDQQPSIDLLVNNVRHRDLRGMDEMTPEALSHLLQVHVVSAYALSRLVATG